MASLNRRGVMWRQFLLDFNIEENSFQRMKCQSFRKIELWENSGISVVYYLNLLKAY